MFGLFRKAPVPRGAVETLNSRGTLCTGKIELPCTLRRISGRELHLTLDHRARIRGGAVVVDHKRALALDVKVVSIKGNEVAVHISARHKLAGLVPARLSRARDIWKRG